jgi:putative peptidoglycan lipid II flippase
MSLLRSSLFVGAAGLISRPLGFLRDVLIAATLGAGPVVDAFVVASRLPDLVRKVLNEGGLNAGFVPLYARLKAERGSAAAARFAGEALSGIALLLAGGGGLVELLAAAIVLALAAGYAGDPATLGLAAECLRRIAPFVLGAGLAAFLGALLNAERRFAMAALAPLSVNLVVLGAIIVLWRRPELDRDSVALWLAAAMGAAGFVQLALVAVTLLRRPAPLVLAKPRLSPELKSLFAVGLPAFALSASGPLIFLAALEVASFTPSAVSWLYYAERIASLPASFVGAAASAVLLPSMAAQVVAGDEAGFAAAQNRALEAACLLAFPAAAALFVLAEPIAAVLFERGAFTRADTLGTAAALAGLAAGLPFGVAAKLFSQAFLVRGHMRVPLLAAALGMAVTILAAFALARSLGVLGIGLGAATGLAAQAAALGFALRRAGRWRPDARLKRRLAAIAGATSVMALGLSGLAAMLAGAPRNSALAAAILMALCVAGFALYAAAAWLLEAVTADDLAMLKSRAPEPRLP